MATAPAGGVGGAVGTRTDGAPAESKPTVTTNEPTGPAESVWNPLTDTGGGPSGTKRPDTSIRSGDRSAQSQDTSTVRAAAGTTGPDAGSAAGRAMRTSLSTGFCTGSATSAWVVTAHGPQRPCTSSGAAPYVVDGAAGDGGGLLRHGHPGPLSGRRLAVGADPVRHEVGLEAARSRRGGRR